MSFIFKNPMKRFFPLKEMKKKKRVADEALFNLMNE